MKTIETRQRKINNLKANIVANILVNAKILLVIKISFFISFYINIATAQPVSFSIYMYRGR